MSYPRLTAVSIADYAEWASLPKSRDALTSLVEIFEQAGCEVEHRELLQGGDNAEIADTLNTWLTGSRGGTLMLFWAGHGVRDGDHFLACANSPKTGLSQFNAISSEGVGEAIAKSGAERILVVLDACHSGAGAGELASAFAGALARIPKGGGDPTISVLASSHAFEKAVDGRFLELMQEALTAPSARRVWRDTDEYLEAFHVAKAIKSLADDKGEAVFVSSSDSGGSRDFIPNPRFRHVVGTEDVETRREQDNALDGLDHFNLAAKGIEVGETGWYFSGRARLLRELTDWLTHADSGIAVVTGPPGSGKSAVVGRLVTLSTPQLREAAASVGVLGQAPDGTLPPEGIIDIAIHAKGKTLDDCWRVVSNGLGFEGHDGAQVDVEAVLDQISALDRRLTIVVDALDEAAQGQGAAIAQSLIVPLGHLTNVRLLVGTRRSLDGAVVPEDEERHGRLHRVFGRDAIIHDLSDEQDTSDDIVAYVEHRLSASRADHALDEIRRAANAVAVEAGDVFLYARVVSRTLQEQATFNTDHLPDGAMAAFELDLKQRFEGNETCVDEMLTALAFGLGRGFSRRAWAPVATALSQTGSTYTAEDVSWMLDHAGWHIVEASVETQNSTHGVYRLVHQAFADHYSERMLAYLENDAAIQRRITEALINTIDNDGPITGKQWLQTDRYIWRHLADHAAQCEMLDTLISDPGYLAVAEPNRLLRQLHSVRTNEARPYADIYRRTVDRLHDITPVERMPYIHLVAQMEHPELAPTLEPPVPTKWKCQWARARPTTPHQIIGRDKGSVHAVELGMINEHLVVFAAHERESVKSWDATTGEPLQNFLPGAGSVRYLKVMNVNGCPLLFAAGYNAGAASVWLWDATTGELIESGVEDLCHPFVLGRINGRAVIVAAVKQGGLQRQDLITGTPIGPPISPETGRADVISLGSTDAGPMIVAGYSDGEIRRFRADTGETVGRPIKAHKGSSVYHVALGELDGLSVMVSVGVDRTVGCWDLISGKEIGHPPEGISGGVESVAVGVADHSAVVVAGGVDGSIRRWYATTGKEIGRALQGHSSYVRNVAMSVWEDSSLIVSGGEDGTIRSWDRLASVASEQERVAHEFTIDALACAKLDDREFIVSVDEKIDAIHVWDARNGEPIGLPVKCQYDWTCSIALAGSKDCPIVVAGGDDGIVRRWDATTAEMIGPPLIGHPGAVSSLWAGSHRGDELIVTLDKKGTIRRWNLITGEPFGKPVDYLGISEISLDKRQYYGGPTTVVTYSHRTLQVWDVINGEPIGSPLMTSYDASLAWVAPGAVDGELLVGYRGEKGMVQRWNSITGSVTVHAMGDSFGERFGGGSIFWNQSPIATSNGRLIMAYEVNDWKLQWWDSASGSLVGEANFALPIRSLAQSEIGAVFVAFGTSLALIEFDDS